MHGSVGKKPRGGGVGSCGGDLPTGVFPVLALVEWEGFCVVIGIVVDIGYQAENCDGVILVRWKV